MTSRFLLTNPNFRTQSKSGNFLKKNYNHFPAIWKKMLGRLKIFRVRTFWVNPHNLLPLERPRARSMVRCRTEIALYQKHMFTGAHKKKTASLYISYLMVGTSVHLRTFRQDRPRSWCETTSSFVRLDVSMFPFCSLI